MCSDASKEGLQRQAEVPETNGPVGPAEVIASHPEPSPDSGQMAGCQRSFRR